MYYINQYMERIKYLETLNANHNRTKEELSRIVKVVCMQLNATFQVINFYFYFFKPQGVFEKALVKV